MTRSATPWLSTQALFGGLLLVVGTLLLLRNFGLLDPAVVRYWPVLLLAVGAVKYRVAETHGDRLLSLGLMAFGSLRLLAIVLHLDLGPLDILATLLIVLGGSTLWRGLRGQDDYQRQRALDPSERVSALAFLGGYNSKNTSPQFRGGDITAFMGGVVIDLRAASIESVAVIDIFVMWGGVELSVPADWHVEVRGAPILGAIEDKTRAPTGATAKRLVVRGTAIMGGIELKN